MIWIWGETDQNWVYLGFSVLIDFSVSVCLLLDARALELIRIADANDKSSIHLVAELKFPNVWKHNDIIALIMVWSRFLV